MSEKRETVIRLRVNPTEREIVKQAAQAQGLSLSSYIRQNVNLPKVSG